MTASLTDALSATRSDQLRRGARALLSRPLLRATGADAEAFRLVCRHADELRAWFDRNTGWYLFADSDVARLVKTTAHQDATHPARDPRSKLPFGRRRYVLTCLALAMLERADAQVTLGRLAEQLVLAAADPDLTEAGVTFHLEGRDQRGDLVAVVRLLLGLGVLTRVAGDEDAFVRDNADVLYDVERRVIATMLASRRGPSTIDEATFEARLATLTGEVVPDSDDLRNRAIRFQLTRRLLDEPVLYYDDLDDAELAYLTRQRTAITTRITELTGLVPEVRGEGIAMVDPHDDLTDVRMPDTGTDGHVTLLLAEHLSAQGERVVPLTELHGHVRTLAKQHQTYWRRDATEAGADVELTRLAMAKLEALRLIRRHPDGVSARPAIGRFALSEPTIQQGRRS
ncbi:MAG: TIGR02678 family protein [Jiangellaceae bacterium]